MTLKNGDNQVTVTMDSIHELDAAGNVIANTGANALKHSRETFASTEFAIGPVYRSNQFGVPADMLDFNTSLVGDTALLTVSTVIFLHDGVIHPTANETWTVGGGTVKFSISVSNWPFCNGEANPHACKGETGEFLEFAMEIKGSDDAALPGGEKRYTLATNAATGNNISLDLSNEVNVDGTWVQMPEGYPKVEMQGGKQQFKFRLPRFSSAALYDPVLQGLETPLEDPPASSSDDGMDKTIIIGLSALGVMTIALAVTLMSCRARKHKPRDYYTRDGKRASAPTRAGPASGHVHMEIKHERF